MKKLICSAVAATLMMAASIQESRATAVIPVLVDLSAPGGASVSSIPVSTGPIATIHGSVSLSFDLDVSTPVPGGVVSQSPLGLGVGALPLSGISDFTLDTAESIDFTISSLVVTAPAGVTVSFDGFTDFNPTENTGGVVTFTPSKASLPDDPVNVENAGGVSVFGIVEASLQFTAVPEPSAFLYGGMIAVVAGLGYSGRRWFAGPTEEMEA